MYHYEQCWYLPNLWRVKIDTSPMGRVPQSRECLPPFPDSGALAPNALFGGLFNICILGCDLPFPVRREIEKFIPNTPLERLVHDGHHLPFLIPLYRRTFFFSPKNHHWVKLLFSTMVLGGWESHNSHIKTAFGMRQVTGSGSIGSFDLQEGFPYISGYGRMRVLSLCSLTHGISPTGSYSRCKSWIRYSSALQDGQRGLEIAVLNKLIMRALQTLLHAQL